MPVHLRCIECGHAEDFHHDGPCEYYGCSCRSFRGAGSAQEEPEEELICVACDHPESEHKTGEQYHGSPAGPGCQHQLGLMRYCTCGGFVRPSPRQQQSTTYRRPPRGVFSRTSGRSEIGKGTADHTPNLQGQGLVSMPGKKQDVNETPEWVMFGIRQSDGTVEVYASTKLTYMTMKQQAPGEFEKIHSDLIRKGIIEDKPWQISGRMVGYVTSKARNYADAIRDLMTRGWKPDGDTEEYGASREDLQRLAALEDLQAEQERIKSEPIAIESSSRADHDDDEIIDAEIVEED